MTKLKSRTFNKLTKRLKNVVQHIKTDDLVTVMDFIGILFLTYRRTSTKSIAQGKMFRASGDKGILLSTILDETGTKIQERILMVSPDSGYAAYIKLNDVTTPARLEISTSVREAIAFFLKNKEYLVGISLRLEAAEEIQAKLFKQAYAGKKAWDRFNSDMIAAGVN